MYVNVKEDWVCGWCKAKNNVEHFRQKHRKGIRCLTCGHEKLTEKEPGSTGETGATWVKEESAVTF